jgi:diguanylate cyclase (GGDEF)-like protein
MVVVDESGKILFANLGAHKIEMRVGRTLCEKRSIWVASLRERDGKVAAGTELEELSHALEQANRRLERLATIDPSTEVLNRRGIEMTLWRELSRGRRSGARMSAVLLTCDELKQHVENLEHAAGEVLLKAIAKRIKGALRPSDHVARIGNYEFLVLLPDTRQAESSQVADKLRYAVGGSPVALSPNPLSVQLAVSVVQVDSETCSIGDILEVARHTALQTSVDRQRAPSTNVKSAAARKVPDRTDLTGALKNGNFHAVTQPIMDLDEERVVGHELLSRGPAGALQMPVDFFRLAIEANMLTTVDLFCLKACVDASKRLRPKGKFHLNLFPSTILGTPTERLMDLLSLNDDAVTFCIEISEQQFIGDPACLRDHVAAFKERGIEVSIDDVGFGRSCLETLIMLEPDVVKIDRCYVDGAASDPHKARLLHRLVQVSRTLGAEIVAEGIESRDDLTFLQDYGVKYGQGWLWGKPGQSFIDQEVA